MDLEHVLEIPSLELRRSVLAGAPKGEISLQERREEVGTESLSVFLPHRHPSLPAVGRPEGFARGGRLSPHHERCDVPPTRAKRGHSHPPRHEERQQLLAKASQVHLSIEVPASC